MPTIGYLSNQNEDSDRSSASAFRRGLGERGYVEGLSVEILYRYTDARGDRRRAVAEDLVRNRVAVIYAAGGPADVEASKAASANIPIVFLTGVDPVRAGLVASLNRPGGNVTGVTFLSQELVPKRLEFLHQVAPSAKSIGYLTAAGDPSITEAETAARRLGVRLVLANASNPREIEAAFTALVGQGIGAFLGGRQGLFFVTAPQLVALATGHKLPAIYAFRESVVAGGLMSYGANIADAAHIAGIYTGRILKGEKPAELPVQQSTLIETVLNLKTARVLGLTIPENIISLADEVIE